MIVIRIIALPLAIMACFHAWSEDRLPTEPLSQYESDTAFVLHLQSLEVSNPADRKKDRLVHYGTCEVKTSFNDLKLFVNEQTRSTVELPVLEGTLLFHQQLVETGHCGAYKKVFPATGDTILSDCYFERQSQSGGVISVEITRVSKQPEERDLIVHGRYRFLTPTGKIQDSINVEYVESREYSPQYLLKVLCGDQDLAQLHIFTTYLQAAKI